MIQKELSIVNQELSGTKKLPFSETHHEYINEEYHLTIHKNLLKRADNM